MQVIILSKVPRPGRVKTRLQPVLGAKRAAQLHRRLLLRTLATAQSAKLGPVSIAFSPDRASQFLRRLDVPLIAQSRGDLGQRMDQLSRRGEAVILLGIDCPGLVESDLQQADRYLEEGGEVVFGPASDGGYWLLGLARPQARLFQGVDWGGPAVLRQSVRNARRAGLTTRLLKRRDDIDRPQDLAHIRLEQPDWLR